MSNEGKSNRKSTRVNKFYLVFERFRDANVTLPVFRYTAIHPLTRANIETERIRMSFSKNV